MTFSLVACDLEAGQWGVGVASKFLAVGSLVPWAIPGVGAVATQAYANPTYGPRGLELLAEGSSADGEAYTGEACGIVVRLEDGKTVYFAGDTCAFGDMQLIKRIHEPDLAVLPIGDHFTMGPREAALALELIGTKRCVPCHWGTFPLLRGTPAELAEHAPPGVTVHAVEPGAPLEL